MNNIVATPNLIGNSIDSVDRQPGATKEHLERVAGEFESVFISLLVKEMRKTTGGEGFFGSENTDSFGSIFDLYIGQHLSESQPLGIASLWLEQYQSNQIPPSGIPQNASTRA